LSKARQTPVDKSILTTLSRRLEDEQAIATDAARWAVESWALAMGLIGESELSVLLPCPACRGLLIVPPAHLGWTVTCPQCNARARISGDGSAATVDPADAEEALRLALRAALTASEFTDDEKALVRAQRQRLGISDEVAQRIYRQVKAERSGGGESTTIATATGIDEPGGISAADRPGTFQTFTAPALPKPRTNFLSIVALVAGVVSLPLFFIYAPAVAAIGAGTIARHQIARAGGIQPGGKLALAGIGCGGASLLAGIGWLVYVASR
jgi:hypothetical protein